MDRDDLRRNLLPFTDRAFGLLPVMDEPRILDIGCGSGLPTLRLVELSGGTIVALDVDEEALGKLRAEVLARGLSHRVEIRCGALEAMAFPEESFDLVWCEGALFVLGFRESLRAWRRYLRPAGCLVAHDEAGDLGKKLLEAEEEGYTELGVVEVPESVWWDEYYSPGIGMPDLAGEIRRFRECPAQFRSAFFVLARKEETC